MAWLSGWRYRRKITISGSSGAGTNYQVRLKIGESSGATGCDFHLDGKSTNFPSGKNQGGDLRFTADDGATLLSFWVESVTGTSPSRVASFWVKVPADLGTAQNIYVYFGNPNATNASDGNNTFLFFDDFEGTTLDTNKWSTEWLYGASYSVANSKITLTTGGTRGHLHTVPNLSAPFAAEIWARKINYDMAVYWFVTPPFTGSGANFATTAYSLLDALWASPEEVELKRYTNQSGTLLASATQTIETGWHKIRIFQKTNGVAGDIDAVQTLSSSDTSYQSGNICLTVREYSGTQVDYDYIFVRKYVSPEPAFSSASGIQVLPSSRRLFLMPI